MNDIPADAHDHLTETEIVARFERWLAGGHVRHSGDRSQWRIVYAYNRPDTVAGSLKELMEAVGYRCHLTDSLADLSTALGFDDAPRPESEEYIPPLPSTEPPPPGIGDLEFDFGFEQE